MKNLVLGLLLIPSTFLGQDSANEFQLKSILMSCQSRGTGVTPLTISFTGNLRQGVLSSVGVNLHSFNVYLSKIKFDKDKLSFRFKGLAGLKSPNAIEGDLNLDLKEAFLDDQSIIVPKGEGKIDLAVRPTLNSSTVLNQYTLSGCIGQVESFPAI